MRDGKLVINGAMDAAGGEYDKVKVNGSATITGDVITEKVGINGRATFTDHVQTGVLKVNGTLAIGGRLSAEKISVNGSLEINKKSAIKVCKIRGRLELKDDLEGQIVDNNGKLDVSGNVSVDQFKSIGCCRIGGLLTAETIMMKLAQSNRVHEIGGDKVVVRRSKFSWGGKLKVGTIEADEIYLEYTTADVVRGNVVRIGPGCKIDRVEYRQDITVSRHATVYEQCKQ